MSPTGSAQALPAELGQYARAAARELALASGALKNHWLHLVAEALETRCGEILEANSYDLASAAELGLTGAAIDRLRLTPDRLRAAAAGVREVAALPDPVGRVLEGSVRPNGLQVHKVGVPLGVIFFIYESRPNVTVDAAVLALKALSKPEERRFFLNNPDRLRRWTEEAGWTEVAIERLPLYLPAGPGALAGTLDRLEDLLHRGRRIWGFLSGGFLITAKA